ncbi:phage protein NinX family protein (plasmid) [Pseudomonas sp. A1437]|uniref:phage protein NinX family protein n=1 Tax=Pseudomonas sp. A1437 TaxID=3235107 RepID=UPI0037835D9F
MTAKTVVETSKLEGLALNWAVGKALGWVDYPDDSIEQGRWWYTDPVKAPFCARIAKIDWMPTNDWNQAGELVDAHIKRMGDCSEPVNGWDAIPEGKQYFAMTHDSDMAFGSTKRIAVCRAVVLAKLGTSVEVLAVLAGEKP